MRRKILSMLTAACLIVGQFTTPALAVDPAAGAAGGTDDIPQATCTCGILCEEDVPDSACPVCSAEGAVLADVCKGQPEEPAASADECTCTRLCAEGAADAACPVCSAEGAVLADVCKGQPGEPAAPAGECTCTQLCAEGAADVSCPVCSAEGAVLTDVCKGQPEEPAAPAGECTCTRLCAEGAVEATCPVCSAEGAVLSEVCKGQPEEPVIPADECTCTRLCAEGAVDAACPVCSAEGAVLAEVCKGQPVPANVLRADGWLLESDGNGMGTISRGNTILAVRQIPHGNGGYSNKLTLTSYGETRIEDEILDLSLPITDASGNEYMINDTDGRIFANSQNLKEVYLPDGMSQLGQAAFENCTGLTTVVFGEGGMDGMTMESNPLYWSLFPGCTNLQTVDLSRTDLRKVGPSMFENLMNLTTAELPDTVTAVEDDAFLFCESLKKVDISNVQSIGYRSFMGCDNLESISPTGELPQIRWIGEAAFARCKSLSGSLIFGPDLSGIGKGAVNATQLTVIDMSQVKNVNIEIGAFSGNDYLERFILPMNGENLSYMLDGCDIDCLVLPDGADPRFWYSFSASRIGVLICEGSVPSERARKGFAGDYPIVVPVDSVDAYKAAWPEYAHRIVAAELLVKPLESDFGSFYEGLYTSRSQVVTLENVSGVELTDVRVVPESDTGILIDTTGLPGTLAPGQKATFTVTMKPDLAAGSYSDSIRVSARWVQDTELLQKTVTVKSEVKKIPQYTVDPEKAVAEKDLFSVVFTIQENSGGIVPEPSAVVVDGEVLPLDAFYIRPDAIKREIIILKKWLDKQEQGVTKTVTFQMDGVPESAWPSAQLEFPRYYDVTLAVAPEGAGTIKGSGIKDGKVTIKAGESIAPEAEASRGYVFAGWRWQDESSYRSTDPAFGFTPESSGTLTAEFIPQYTIKLYASPVTTGNVFIGDNVVHEVVVTDGESVTLTARSKPDWEFLGWRWGDDINNIISTDPTFEFTPTESGDLLAEFRYRFEIELKADPPGSGTILAEGVQADVIRASSIHGVPLTAVAAEGYEFVGWRWEHDAGYLNRGEDYHFTPWENGVLKAVFRPLTASTVAVGGIYLDSSSGPVYATVGSNGRVTLQKDFTEESDWQIRLQGNTLTLRGADMVNGAIVLGYGRVGIWWQGDLILELQGENTITTDSSYSLYGEGGTLTVQGTGSLTVDSSGYTGSTVRLEEAGLIIQDSANVSLHTGTDGGRGIYADEAISVQGTASVVITTDGEAEEGIVTGDTLTVQGAADLRVLGTSTGISAGAVTAAGSATLTAEASLPDGKAIASVGSVLVQDTALLSARSNGAGGRAVVAADVTVQGDADLSAAGSLAGISATNAVTVKNTANLTALADGTAAEAITAAAVTVQDEADLAAEASSSGGIAIAASGDVSVQGAASLTASAGEGGQSVRAANTKLIPDASRRICAIAGENAEAAQPLAGSPFAAETTLTDPLGRYFEAWGADSTTLTLASSSGSIIYGESVDYTVQAAGTAAGASAPTGKVQFYLGSTDQGNELGEPLMLQDGRATLTLDRSTLIYTGSPYKVLAVYEGDRDYAPAQSETTTAVAQRQLEWKAELSASKAYDGTTAAPDVYGTVEVSGVLDGDDVVFGYTGLRAAEFTVSDGGTTETLAVTVENAALTGAQAGNYLLPVGALTVEAEIHETETVPAEPESPSTPGALLYRVQIEEGVSRVPDSLTGTYRSPAELEKALYDALAGSGIAAGNMAAYDFVLYVSSDDGSSWTPAAADQFPDQGLILTLPYPAGTGSSGIDFVLMQTLAASADGEDFETLNFTRTAEGIRVTLQSLNPAALGWKSVPAQGGGSGSSSSGRQEEFWEKVKEELRYAEPGDTVKVNAGSYDRMPYSVMKTLGEQDDVTLRITWNGGGPIEIPSGFAAEEEQRVYYPLEELAEMDFTLQADTPADVPSVQGPAGTGSGTGTAVQPGGSSAADPEDTGSVPEAAEPDAESSDPDEPAEPAGPADSGEEQSGTGGLLPAGLALVAVLAVILLWRRRRDNEQK